MRIGFFQFLVLLAISLEAASPPVIEGTITDSSGAPIYEPIIVTLEVRAGIIDKSESDKGYYRVKTVGPNPLCRLAFVGKNMQVFDKSTFSGVKAANTDPGKLYHPEIVSSLLSNETHLIHKVLWRVTKTPPEQVHFSIVEGYRYLMKSDYEKDGSSEPWHDFINQLESSPELAAKIREAIQEIWSTH